MPRTEERWPFALFEAMHLAAWIPADGSRETNGFVFRMMGWV